jgi:L-2,4-diaminobutyrate decarboxylase
VDKEFSINSDGLHQAVDLMSRDFSDEAGLALPLEMPQVGMGSTAVLNSLAPSILGGATRLGEATSFAHTSNTTSQPAKSYSLPSRLPAAAVLESAWDDTVPF